MTSFNVASHNNNNNTERLSKILSLFIYLFLKLINTDDNFYIVIFTEISYQLSELYFEI